jgi:hypothetical protein
MKRHLQILTGLLFVSFGALHSQYYFYNSKYYNSPVLAEVGLSLGIFNCLTDLGGGEGPGQRFIKDVNVQNSHIGGGIYAGVIFDQLFGLRAEVSIGKVSASDNVLKNDHSAAMNRYHRNLHFESNIIELSIIGEFLPLSLLNKESYPLLSPYILAGAGLFNFNPRAYYKGKWIDLHPLHTEGQGFKEYPTKQPYKLTQLNFPLGVGIRYEISAVLNTRLEVVYRLLRTDYLDDVSTQYIDPEHFYSNLNLRDAAMAVSLSDRSSELQSGVVNYKGQVRGNPANRDAYFSCNLKLGMLLNRKRR